MRNTTSGSGFFKRAASRDSSTTSARDKNPMSESTMFFLKHAFGKEEQRDFYSSCLKSRKQSPPGSDEDDETNHKTPLSLLKSRRSTNFQQSIKENKQPLLKQSKVSSEIHSLIETYHQESKIFKEELISKQPEKNIQRSNSKTKAEEQLKMNVYQNAPIKIKVLGGNVMKVKRNDSQPKILASNDPKIVSIQSSGPVKVTGGTL